MHLIAIDPGVRKSGLVIWWGDPPQLMDVGLVSTNQLLLMPGRFIALTHDTHRIAIVEGQYIDRRSKVATKSILKLARVAGRIDMRLEMLGFEMIEAPAWGKNSWVSIFSTGGVLPHREQLRSMSVWWASAACFSVYGRCTGCGSGGAGWGQPPWLCPCRASPIPTRPAWE